MKLMELLLRMKALVSEETIELVVRFLEAALASKDPQEFIKKRLQRALEPEVEVVEVRRR